MALSLVLTLPDGSTQTYALDQDELVLGRDPSSGVSLADAKVSRRHARVVRREETYWLEDLGSANGVILDGLPLSGRALISAGSAAEIGDCKLHFVVASGQEPKSQAPSRYASPDGLAAGGGGTRFALRVVDGELLGQSFVLNLNETIVGRGEDADVTLEVASISRRHAVIRQHGADSVLVEDLGSANGTFVGDLAIEQERVLRVGEQIRFGALLLELTVVQQTKPLARRSTPPLQSADSDPPPVAKPTQPASAPAAAQSEAASHPQHPIENALGRATTAAGQLLRRVRGLAAAHVHRNHAMAAVAIIGLILGVALWRASRRAPQASRSTALQGQGAGQRPERDVTHPDAQSQSPTAGVASLRSALLGYGPRSAERAWRARTDAALASATAAADREEWEHAQGSLGKALKLDPTAPKALRLRARIEAGVQVEASLQQASAHRAAGRWSQALLVASDALREADSGGHADADALAAKTRELGFLVADARNHLAAFCREESRVACSQERYETCISQAACALGYDPNDEQALAALTLAAAVVDPQRSARPVAGPGTEQGIDVGSAPTLEAAALVAPYPDASIRLALLAYAAGDMPQATLRLRNLDSDEANAVLAQLASLELQRARGAKAEETNAWEEALPAYKKALEMDSRLLPAALPCGPRSRLTEAVQRVLFSIGEAAGAQGNFAEALSSWQHADALRPGYLPVAQGLYKLEVRATELLDAAAPDAPGGHKLSHAELCATIDNALAMTSDESPVHRRAGEMGRRCEGVKNAMHD